MDNTNATHSLIVVLENPSKTFDVVCCDPGMKFSALRVHIELDCVLFPELQVGVRDAELLLIIPFTITRLPESMLKIVRIVMECGECKHSLDGVLLFHGPIRVHLER